MAIKTPKELFALLLSNVRQGTERTRKIFRENLRERSVVMHEGVRAGDETSLLLDTPRRFPSFSGPSSMPLIFPDEILDYYAWVFCQSGFLGFQMTFEQFLTVVTAVRPSGLCPEYDETDLRTATDSSALFSVSEI
jgi:hypothetical protein